MAVLYLAVYSMWTPKPHNQAVCKAATCHVHWYATHSKPKVLWTMPEEEDSLHADRVSQQVTTDQKRLQRLM